MNSLGKIFKYIIKIVVKSLLAILVFLLRLDFINSTNSFYRDFYYDFQVFLMDIFQTNSVKDQIKNQNLFKKESDFDYRKYKNADTVFILGAGSSINDLSNDSWSHIKSQNSIGFNFWLIHEHIPTYYFFETSPNQSTQNTLKKLFEIKADLYKEVPCFCQFKQWQAKGRNIQNLLSLNLDFKNNIYLYAPYNLFSKSSDFIKFIFHLWNSLKLYQTTSLIHHCASLSSLIMFAYSCGYKNIVLAGVDLNDTKHFWETSPNYLDMPKPENEHKANGPVHGTVVIPENVNALPIDQYIELMNENILKPNDIKLFISSKKSRLYPYLPLYEKFID